MVFAKHNDMSQANTRKRFARAAHLHNFAKVQTAQHEQVEVAPPAVPLPTCRKCRKERGFCSNPGQGGHLSILQAKYTHRSQIPASDRHQKRSVREWTVVGNPYARAYGASTSSRQRLPAPQLAAQAVGPLKRRKCDETSAIQTGFAQLGNPHGDASSQGYYLLRYDNVGDAISFDGAHHFHRTLNHYECLAVEKWPNRSAARIQCGRARSRRAAQAPQPTPDLCRRLEQERAALAAEAGITADILRDDLTARRPVLKLVRIDPLSLDEWKRVLSPKAKPTLTGWNSYPFVQSHETDFAKFQAEQKARSWKIPRKKLLPNSPFWCTEAGKHIGPVLDAIRAAFPAHCGGVHGQARDAHLLLQTRDGGPTAFTFHKDLQHGELEPEFQRSICILLASGENELLKVAFFF